MTDELDLLNGRWRMEVRVQGKCGPVVNNVDDGAAAQAQQQLQDRQEQWVAQLRGEPVRRFKPIWKHRFIEPFSKSLADQVVAGVLAQATAADHFAKDAQKK